MILDKNQIKKYVASLKCGSQSGTAFLISKDKVLTAYHCIDEYYNNPSITLELTFKYLEKDPIKAIPLNMDVSRENNLDIVILKLEKEIILDTYLTLSGEDILEEDEWNTFGYPKIEELDGVKLQGKVILERLGDNTESYNLIIQADEELPVMAGLSGSPLIIDGNVKGIITYDRRKRNTLGAVSIKKAQIIFEQLDIETCLKKNHTKLNVISNNLTQENLLDCIYKNSCGYIFFKGSPGSGKTTFIYNLELKNENIIILGKYYLKGIDTQYNIQYNSSGDILGKWFINTINKYLYNSFLNVENKSEIELIKKVDSYLKTLSDLGIKENKKFIFFIDGIDEILLINKERINTFFEILPNNLYENIFIIISGNNEELIPMYIEKKIVINITPLNINEIIYFVNNEINSQNLILIKKIAEKSEGNPLYLKYLIKYLKNQSSITEDILNTIPSFSGEIKNYYELYWKKIENDSQIIKVLALLSRIRKNIQKEEFFKLFSLEEKYNLEVILLKVNHLINNKNNTLKIYHSSFEEFIKEKTLSLNENMHNIIAKFCLENKESFYSLENKLYHLINSRDFKLEALNNCNQDWLDLCAIKNTDLELMFVDIENMLNFAINEGKFSDIIRILLLSQRLKFRNEKLFRTFSVEIAKALYEIGKVKEILNYIIYEDNLVESISIKDIKYFLFKLFKDNYIVEGEKLLKAIENKCLNEFTKKKISSEIISLDIISSFYKSKEECIAKIEYYGKIFPEIKENITCEFIAWYINHFNIYFDVQNLEKFFNIKIDVTHIEYLNKIIFFYLEQQDSYCFLKEDSKFYLAIKDLENLLIKYNIQKDSNSLSRLILFSNNTTLLEKLIQNEEKQLFNLRSQNQVDFNFKDFIKYYNYHKYRGYLEDNFEKNEENFNNWENFILYIIGKTGNILGRCYKAKALSDENRFSEIHKMILELLEDLNINFKERVKWERAYFIPENVIPIIYKELTFIYVNFFKDKLDEFKEVLTTNYQLGLYNEGYRRALFHIAEEIIKEKSLARKAFSIVSDLENFIEKYILNRWERNRDFLKVMKLYGKIGALEKANSTYQKILKNSMGPSWYKESQLTLMITSVEKLKNLKNKEKYISQILANLQYASGEMTFQRYIRDDKEKIVSVIYRNLNRKKAIEYLEKTIFPTYEELLTNVKQETADMITPTQGYIRGTNEVDIQDIMYYFINELKNVDPLIKYALTEIFIQGDERYFKNYTKLQIEILSNIKDITSKDYLVLSERIKRQYIVELDERKRSIYVNILKNFDKIACIKNLLLELNNINIQKATLKNPITPESNSEHFEEIPIIALAKMELEIGNTQQVKKMIADKLIEIYKEHGDIFNWSYESINCLNLLEEVCENEIEFIQLIKPICFNNYNEDWVIANELMDKLGNKLCENESEKIMEIILEHMELMLRVPKNYIEKYKWIEKNNLNNEKYEVEKYIIYLTNFPHGIIYKNKATEILIWLGEKQPNIIIPLLVEESLMIEKRESSEVAASILHNLSKRGFLEHIWYFIQLNDIIKTKILEEKHFVIKSYYYEIIKLAKKKGFLNVEEYFQTLENSFFSIANINTKLELNNFEKFCPYLNERLIEKFKRLNNIINIDEKFLEKLFFNLSEKISPLNIEELKEIDEIYERSYSIPKNRSNIYGKIIENEINLLLNNYVNFEKYENLKKEMRHYNPYFPESYYCLEIPDLYSEIEKILFEQQSMTNKILFYNDKLILAYNEFIIDRKERKINEIDMTAFLIKDSKKIEKIEDKFWDEFPANLTPEEAKINSFKSKDLYQLVRVCSYVPCDNSWNTPADIHPQLLKDYNINYCEEIKRKNWKRGTILDVEGFGIPIGEGTLLTIDKNFIEKLDKEYKLMFKISYNSGEKILFLDTKNRIVYKGGVE